MNKQNLIYLAVLLLSLGVCVWGLISLDVKPILPLEKMTPCSCVSECLQDFQEYNTVNFFTMIRHKEFNYESRVCEALNQTIKNTCCVEQK